MTTVQQDLPLDTPLRPVPPQSAWLADPASGRLAPRHQSNHSHRNFGETAVQRNVPPLLASWLELVVAPSWRLEQAQAHIHPIDGLAHACYAITLDDHWLCGDSGALALFLSYDAATRFMRMLHIAHYRRAGRRKVAKEQNTFFQCFKLGNHGLGLCDKCGSEHCDPASRTGYSAWEDDYP